MSAHDISVAAARQWEDTRRANASSSSESTSSDSSDSEESPEEESDSSIEGRSTLDDDEPLIPPSRAKVARFD
jgi:hypothetical protein